MILNSQHKGREEPQEYWLDFHADKLDYQQKESKRGMVVSYQQTMPWNFNNSIYANFWQL